MPAVSGPCRPISALSQLVLVAEQPAVARFRARVSRKAGAHAFPFSVGSSTPSANRSTGTPRALASRRQAARVGHSRLASHTLESPSLVWLHASACVGRSGGVSCWPVSSPPVLIPHGNAVSRSQNRRWRVGRTKAVNPSPLLESFWPSLDSLGRVLTPTTSQLPPD
jgi:hypothetical protein